MAGARTASEVLIYDIGVGSSELRSVKSHRSTAYATRACRRLTSSCDNKYKSHLHGAALFTLNEPGRLEFPGRVISVLKNGRCRFNEEGAYIAVHGIL